MGTYSSSTAADHTPAHRATLTEADRDSVPQATIMSIFQPAPEPKTALGRKRILSPTCGLRVSPLCLGAMSIGDAWSDFMGSMDKEASFKLLDAFYDAGANFVDSANNYQNGQSESWIGEWMEQRGIRDQIVVAS